MNNQRKFSRSSTIHLFKRGNMDYEEEKSLVKDPISEKSLTELSEEEGIS